MHTSYRFNKNEYLDHKFVYLDNKIYVKNNEKYYSVDKINGYNFNEIVKRLKEIIPCETEAYFCKLMNVFLNNGYIYKIINVPGN